MASQRGGGVVGACTHMHVMTLVLHKVVFFFCISIPHLIFLLRLNELQKSLYSAACETIAAPSMKAY